MENRTITALYMGWHQSNPENPHRWLPISRIVWDEKGNYYLSYTEGFNANSSLLLGLINEKAGYSKVWHLKEPYPAIRYRTPTRPDSMYIYDLLDIPKQQQNSINYLARSAARGSDRRDFFPEVLPNNKGNFEFYFLPRYEAKTVGDIKFEIIQFVDNAAEGQLLTLDVGKVRTSIYSNDLYIGYCPDYIHFFLTECAVESAVLSIEKVTRGFFLGLEEKDILLKCELEPVKGKSIYDHPYFVPLNKMPEKEVVAVGL